MPHQQKAIDEMSDGKILYGDVGTGKSLTALGYYMQKAAPLPLLIVTTARKRDTLDWEGEGAKYGIFTRHGDAVAGKMTVISWNQIHKYADIKGHFVILDEQRLVGSGKWVKSFLKMAPNNRWILLDGLRSRLHRQRTLQEPLTVPPGTRRIRPVLEIPQG
jgi:hypothetical protein